MTEPIRIIERRLSRVVSNTAVGQIFQGPQRNECWLLDSIIVRHVVAAPPPAGALQIYAAPTDWTPGVTSGITFPETRAHISHAIGVYVEKGLAVADLSIGELLPAHPALLNGGENLIILIPGDQLVIDDTISITYREYSFDPAEGREFI